jgi:hypothetical protein
MQVDQNNGRNGINEPAHFADHKPSKQIVTLWFQVEEWVMFSLSLNFRRGCSELVPMTILLSWEPFIGTDWMVDRMV